MGVAEGLFVVGGNGNMRECKPIVLELYIALHLHGLGMGPVWGQAGVIVP